MFVRKNGLIKQRLSPERHVFMKVDSGCGVVDPADNAAKYA